MVKARDLVWIPTFFLFAAAGCKQRVVLYCDEDTPCESAERPFCDVEGEYPASEGAGNTCIPDPFPDAGPVGKPDAAPGGSGATCPAGETTACVDDQLLTCDDAGDVTGSEPCPLGCHTDEPRCNDLDPSNGLAPQLDEAKDGPDVVLSDGATIDTTTGEVTNGDGSPVSIPSDLLSAPAGGVDVRVLKVHRISFGDITIEGDPALAVVSDDSVHVLGRLRILAGHIHEGDPCVGQPGDCGDDDDDGSLDACSGGGGGGFGTVGGKGGAGGKSGGGSGGAIVGSSDLQPLRGGCSGSALPSRQAAGGGALQLVSRREILFESGGDASGHIDAAGLGGQSSVNALINIGRTAAGGGSGGGVLLEAPSIVFKDGTGVAANGGGGGSSCGEGDAGDFSETPASGSTCSTSGRGNGGDGAAVGIGATPAPAAGVVGGGGGGGAGRIRINTADGGLDAASSAVLSPEPSLSEVARR